MVNEQQLRGRWDEVRGKVRERWGQLTSDEMDEVRGDATQLVGLIERRTGESREAIERYLNELIEQGAEMAGRAAQAAHQAGQQAAAAAERVYSEASRRARESFRRAEELFREHPAGSVATIFTMGVLSGVILAVLASSR